MVGELASDRVEYQRLLETSVGDPLNAHLQPEYQSYPRAGRKRC